MSKIELVITDEMALMRLATPSLDVSNEALLRRIKALEDALRSGVAAPAPAPTAPAPSGSWKCTCGAVSNGNFCPDCGFVGVSGCDFEARCD